jgi:hypothetical protein
LRIPVNSGKSQRAAAKVKQHDRTALHPHVRYINRWAADGTRGSSGGILMRVFLLLALFAGSLYAAELLQNGNFLEG